MRWLGTLFLFLLDLLQKALFLYLLWLFCVAFRHVKSVLNADTKWESILKSCGSNKHFTDVEKFVAANKNILFLH